jgi:hypothetical protein
VTGSVPPEVALRDLPVDAFVERYVDWREQCEALDSAYRGWVQATWWTRDTAFETYRAALDREAKAADAYERATARLEDAERQ